jgi:hypothetical protein
MAIANTRPATVLGDDVDATAVAKRTTSNGI